jgi:hypothetical protein
MPSLFSSLLLLTACGGGGGGNNDDGNSTAGRIAEGNLVVPQQTSQRNQEVLLRAQGVAFRDCSDIPAGYSALADTTVEFLDDSDQILQTTTTDSCGAFMATIPDEVTRVRATSTDYRDLVVDVSLFTTTGGGVASTIPATATYQISSIQFTGGSGDSIAFSVTDSETNTAVIGIPDTAFSVAINANPVSLNDLQLATQSADPASITLVMDSSGSMGSLIFDENFQLLEDDNGVAYDRYRLTSLAAHTYLDNMPSSDETAIIAFSSQVFLMNDATITNEFLLEDENGNDASYNFSADGYTTTAADLRFVVDAYNRSSQLYSPINPDSRHPDTPNLSVVNFYPLGGNTALYDAIEVGLVNTESRAASRKVVIAMSDGEDNSSALVESDVITSAVNKNIPVYTIAFGGANPTTMENIALGTNASFYAIEDVDLTSIFQTIQTGIIFQYLAVYEVSANAGDTLNLTLAFNGLTTTRSIVR